MVSRLRGTLADTGFAADMLFNGRAVVSSITDRDYYTFIWGRKGPGPTRGLAQRSCILYSLECDWLPNFIILHVCSGQCSPWCMLTSSSIAPSCRRRALVSCPSARPSEPPSSHTHSGFFKSLRAWKQTFSEIEAPLKSPSLGRRSQLPHSLFLGASASLKEIDWLLNSD